MEDTVTISKKEYERLVRVDRHMDVLFANGVDNWGEYTGPPDDDDTE